MTTLTRRVTRPAAQLLNREYDWRDDAACRQYDPEMWFPVGSSAAAREQEDAAKRICGGCPVRSECLDWAIESGQSSGVWGGLSEDERRRVSGDRSGQFQRCIEAQELIERRIAEGVKYRGIGEELGVGHHAVCRAVKFFRAERAEVSA